MTLFNLVKVNTATTGTGTLTLGSAVAGYLTAAQAGVVNGDTVSYEIIDGTSREVGHGTYTASGTTLSRDTVESSTNSGSKINCSGSAVVAFTALASDIVIGPASAAGDNFALFNDTTGRLVKDGGAKTAANIAIADTGNYYNYPSDLEDALIQIFQAIPYGGNYHFYFSDTASDIGGSYLTLADNSGVTFGAVTTASLTTGNNQLILTLATPAGQPASPWIQAGEQVIYIKANLGSLTRTAYLHARLYLRTAGGTETLVKNTVYNADRNYGGYRSTTGDALNGSASYYRMFIPITDTSSFNVTDRWVLKIYADISGAGGDGTIVLNADAKCGLFARVDSQMLQNIFMRKDAPTGTYTPTNVSTDRSYDANATTLDEVADVLGTLIADLQARGLIG